MRLEKLPGCRLSGLRNSGSWGGRSGPIVQAGGQLVWHPSLTNAAAAEVLTATARRAADVLCRTHLQPRLEDLCPDGQHLDVVDCRRHVDRAEAVLHAGLWRVWAADSRWQLVAPTSEPIRVRRVLVTGADPAIVARHPEAGWCFAHWTEEPFETGLRIDRLIQVMGCIVAETNRLPLRTTRIVGHVWFGDARTEMSRRVFHEHRVSVRSHILSNAYARR